MGFNAMHTRVQEQIIRDQYSTLYRIVCKLSMSHISREILRECNVINEQAFVKTFWPFPQSLLPQVISKIMENRELRDIYLPIYDRALLLFNQDKIFKGIKQEIKSERLAASVLDFNALDTLGWRGWNWNNEEHLLISPAFGTKWISPDLRVEKWEDSDSLRGVAGIHARRIPKNWKIAVWGGFDAPNSQITGIVERFGKYVLGELGWRAEWVVIRKLLAPTQEIGFALEMAYPEIPVEYFDTVRYGEY